MESLKLKRGKESRVLQGHPWVYAGEVKKLLGEEFNGEVVECRDERGRFLGSGLYNQTSQIVWRRFSREKSMLDHEQLKELILRAIARREPGKPCQRLVWSESDFLPGLIVDLYEKTVVVQTLTLGMDRRQDMIVGILTEALKPHSIVLRNDVSVRKLEGLQENTKVAYGNVTPETWAKIGEIQFCVDVLQGQKTGFYLDQQDQYTRIMQYAKDREILDVFCHQGGFGLHCAKAGAKCVVGVDISADALERGRINAQKNKLSVEFIENNAFDFLKAGTEQNWDMIILDPPPFTKTKHRIQEACRGYKEIHLRSMKLLRKNGILATYCCSHHISKDLFRQIVASAAKDANKDIRILDFCHQSSDHPILLQIPESEYLHGLILQVL